MKFVPLLGRILFSCIFILSSFNHFNNQTIQYAANAGVPFASLLVPLSGLLALFGGLSILLGYKTRFGAWLIILFLIPVTLTMHRFWGVADPGAARMQMIMFMKNLSMLGGAFLIYYFGPGPYSLDKND